jgi:hypothetical protein
MGDFPLWGAVLIAKNEADQITACLTSAAKAGIAVVTLLDTGSVDATVELAESSAKGLGLDFRVHRTEFRNFGQARSEAFALAHGTASWIVALDADMSVEIDPRFTPDPSLDCYMVRMGSADFEYRLPLALNGSVPFRSIGSVHEYTARVDGQAHTSAPTDKVRVTMHGGDRSSREKSLWHLSMLEDEIRREPDNARAVFYLANTRRDLGDPRAVAAYERRIRMGGYAEEVFYSMYRYALLLPTWPAQVMALIAAWEMRPQRLEPVYELAKGLNYRGQHHAALGFARTPVAPSTDALFVHSSVWRWGMDFERSIAEWHAGDREECRRISERLLTIDIPQNVRDAVERNLSFC